jgi:DNA mismatch repair protein MutS
LKEFAYRILHAEEEIASLEHSLFLDLQDQLASKSGAMRQAARALGELDVLIALSENAELRHYVRPQVDLSGRLWIEEGRHPTLEAFSPESFIANDLDLNPLEGRQMILLTGPNMAGKSTYMRQIALIVLLAQMGSFVPAKKAIIGIVDKLFTRIGASDDLTRGKSTFMVEMAETAHILHQATERSLVILDEIGRGTSTYDGIALARSTAEYLLTQKGKQAKTLFATHYVELTDIEKQFPTLLNYHMAIEERAGEITFLRSLRRGSADKSYGIHVAKLAGLPSSVIQRARSILTSFEQRENQKEQSVGEKENAADSPSPSESLKEELTQLHLDQMTPLQALQTLNLWKERFLN